MPGERKLVEADIELAAVKWAEDRNVLTRKLQWIGRRNAPDRLFAVKGRAIFVEFKRPGGKPRIGQDLEIKRMKGAGLDVHVVDSFAGFVKLFKDIENMDDADV